MFFPFLFFFQDHNELSTFPPNFFPGNLFQSMQVQPITTAGKNSLTLKGAPYNFWFSETKTFLRKSWYPLTHGNFGERKPSKTPKAPLTVFFCDTKSFWHLYCDTPSMIYQKFGAQQISKANFELLVLPRFNGIQLVSQAVVDVQLMC